MVPRRALRATVGAVVCPHVLCCSSEHNSAMAAASQHCIVHAYSTVNSVAVKVSILEVVTAWIFSAAGPIPYIRQFVCQFCQFACWLLSDKNLNALKTSRYKTFPSRLKETLGLFMFLYT